MNKMLPQGLEQLAQPPQHGPNKPTTWAARERRRRRPGACEVAHKEANGLHEIQSRSSSAGL